MPLLPGLEPDGRLSARPSGRHLAAGVDHALQQPGTIGHRPSLRPATPTTTTAEDAASAVWRTVGTPEVDAIWRLFRPDVKTLVNVSRPKKQRRLDTAGHLRRLVYRCQVDSVAAAIH